METVLTPAELMQRLIVKHQDVGCNSPARVEKAEQEIADEILKAYPRPSSLFDPVPAEILWALGKKKAPERDQSP